MAGVLSIGRVLAVAGLFLIASPVRSALARPCQEAKSQTPRKSTLPSKPPPPDEPPPADGGPLAYAYSTDEAIAFCLARIKANPRDHITYRMLGELTQRKAGTSHDPAVFGQAEGYFRKSLELAPDYVPAKLSLAFVLCQRHRFAEALEIATAARKAKPRDPEALAIIADAQIELGRYDEGERTLSELFKRSPTAPVLARQANLAELKGQSDEAIRLMRQALELVRSAGGGPSDVAWYQGRLGDLALAAGRLEEAERLYLEVPEGTDPVHDATAARGQIRAMEGEFKDAIVLYEKAVAIGPDPHMVAALGDLYSVTGQAEKAEACYSRLLKLTEGVNEYDRERSKFLSDHDRALPEALRLAERDFQQRQDIHGHDTLAWALFKNGRAREALAHSESALKLGTREPALEFHAGMIHHALGDDTKAREHLKNALAHHSRFSVLQADTARKVLEEIEKKAAP